MMNFPSAQADTRMREQRAIRAWGFSQANVISTFAKREFDWIRAKNFIKNFDRGGEEHCQKVISPGCDQWHFKLCSLQPPLFSLVETKEVSNKYNNETREREKEKDAVISVQYTKKFHVGSIHNNPIGTIYIPSKMRKSEASWLKG